MATMTEPISFELFYNVIDGQLQTTRGTRHGINPSTLEANPDVPISTKDDVNRATCASRAAFGKWSKLPYSDRRKAVIAFADGLLELREEFSVLLTREQGKPFHLAEMEVESSVRRMKEMADIPFMDDIVRDSETEIIRTRYTPLGVVGGIVPWNFPLTLACDKIAPALLTGNTMILKPSPFTPYCGLKLAELGRKHFPPSVLQALSGDDMLGEWLTEHPNIDKISFTGSTITGKRVMESCSKTLKRVTLELGGNDAAIICANIDIGSVASAVAQLSMFNSGQVCIAIKRIYVHYSIYALFLEAFEAAIKTMKVGDGFAKGVALGPVQNKAQYDRVLELIRDINRNNYTKREITQTALDSHGPGYFITPMVVDNPPDDSMIVSQEPFGPIIPLLKWNSEEEVINRVNDTRYGLGASVWSSNIEQANQLAMKLEAGSVWVNSHMYRAVGATFCGHKESGLGIEGGLAGLRSYCNAQTLYLAN